MQRKQITIDQETKNIIDTHGINASKEFRNFIKDKFGSIEVLEKKLEQKKSEREHFFEKKQEFERKLHEINKEIEDLEHILVKSDVMQHIKQDKIYRSKVNDKVRIIKQAMDEGDSDEEIQAAIEKNAKILSDELPFEQEKLVKVLKNCAYKE